MFRVERIEHFFFIGVLFSVVALPRVKVHWLFPGFPIDSTVNVGIVFLFAWFIYEVGRRRIEIVADLFRNTEFFVFFCFFFYLFVVSAVWSDTVGKIKAAQLLAYCFLSGVLISDYMMRVRVPDDAGILSRVILWVLFLVPVAGAISLWGGPIYPWQTVNNIGRIWCGEHIPQAVGFGYNPNVEGRVYIFIITLALWCWWCGVAPTRLLNFFYLGVMISCVALIATFSRMAVFDFIGIAMLLVVGSMVFARSLMNKTMGVVLVAALSASLVILVVSQNGRILNALKYGYGLGSYEELCLNFKNPAQNPAQNPARLLMQAESGRVKLWEEAYKKWREGTYVQRLFGRGMGYSFSDVRDDFGRHLAISVHSTWLAVLLDAGLIGLGLLAVAWGYAIWSCVKGAAQGRGGALLGGVFLASLALDLTVESFIYGVEYVFMILVILSISKVHLETSSSTLS